MLVPKCKTIWRSARRGGGSAVSSSSPSMAANSEPFGCSAYHAASRPLAGRTRGPARHARSTHRRCRAEGRRRYGCATGRPCRGSGRSPASPSRPDASSGRFRRRRIRGAAGSSRRGSSRCRAGAHRSGNRACRVRPRATAHALLPARPARRTVRPLPPCGRLASGATAPAADPTAPADAWAEPALCRSCRCCAATAAERLAGWATWRAVPRRCWSSCASRRRHRSSTARGAAPGAASASEAACPSAARTAPARCWACRCERATRNRARRPRLCPASRARPACGRDRRRRSCTACSCPAARRLRLPSCPARDAARCWQRRASPSRCSSRRPWASCCARARGSSPWRRIPARPCAGLANLSAPLPCHTMRATASGQLSSGGPGHARLGPLTLALRGDHYSRPLPRRGRHIGRGLRTLGRFQAPAAGDPTLDIPAAIAHGAPEAHTCRAAALLAPGLQRAGRGIQHGGDHVHIEKGIGRGTRELRAERVAVRRRLMSCVTFLAGMAVSYGGRARERMVRRTRAGAAVVLCQPGWRTSDVGLRELRCL